MSPTRCKTHAMPIARSRAETVRTREELLEVVEPLQKIFRMYVEVGQVDRTPLVLPPVEVAVVPRGMMQLGHVANQIGPGGRAAKELARADLHRALVLWEQAREASGGLRLAHHGHQLAPGSRRQIVPGDERDHLMARVVPCARGPQGTRQDNPRNGQDGCDDPHETSTPPRSPALRAEERALLLLGPLTPTWASSPRSPSENPG